MGALASGVCSLERTLGRFIYKAALHRAASLAWAFCEARSFCRRKLPSAHFPSLWEPGKETSLLQPHCRPCSTLAVSAEGNQACTKGCELCSEVNGCLKCSPKLFILLERNDIRQVGVCLPSCPPGYFDARNPDMNKCISECAQGAQGHRRLWILGEGI